ncbi:hypothetical protein OHS33_01490 [Streptomyces sp. NBC_00536]|uniref:hypothetical protein n=1 Tax=Streptomyces sp. NBC_00536 TaxID=2975769 RepID=UPI002E81B368|nr:hypothetical protein [Streptomyces sp. NBC_00536]WUC77137.1 hypothetical protein OHS33_01490 [Streptomyces sp. NBC_00536]
MNNPVPEETARPAGWAEHVVDQLTGMDEVDQGLITAVHGQPDLTAETGVRRAHALHAAAMGLGPAGCAAAAGISEALLANWRQDPAFDAALSAAGALAGAERVAHPGQLNGFALGILLRSLARDAHLGTAAHAAGITREQLTRLRRGNPAVNSLIEAALRRARVRQSAGRRTKRGFGYRLVHRAEAPAADSTGADEA